LVDSDTKREVVGKAAELNSSVDKVKAAVLVETENTDLDVINLDGGQEENFMQMDDNL